MSYLSQELGFSNLKHARDDVLGLLLLTNAANHLLNLACTVGDAGALGAIL